MKSTCPDCGTIPSSSHLHQWVESFFTEWVSRFSNILPMARLHRYRFTHWLSQWWWKGFVHLFVLTRASRYIHQPHPDSSWRTKALWESAKRLGVNMTGVVTFGYVSDLFFARHEGTEIFFESLPRPFGSGNAMPWMDDKGIARTRLGKAGLPVPQGGVARSLKSALELFRAIPHPAIVKPLSGSGARHATINVHSEQELASAFARARRVSYSVVVEEHIPGDVHRALVIDGKFVALARRERPNVTGDGTHTILELVEIENQNPARQGPIFHALPTDEDTHATRNLAENGYRWNDIPTVGTRVFFAAKEHRILGATIRELTKTTHPDIIALTNEVGRAVNDPIIGVDIILSDHTKSWRDQPSAIIELNSMPFIDLHHYPLYGEPIPVADAIWKMVFPEVKNVSP